MNTVKRRLKGAVAVASISGIALAAGLSAAQAQDLPGEGKSVQPIATGQTGHIFQHAIVEKGLERLGYDVKPSLEAQYPPMHLAIAEGDADYTAIHWDSLHAEFYEQSGGAEKLTRVGALTPGAAQGYFIDRKTAEEHGITNIGQLTDPEIAKIFDIDGDGRADLTGCEAGWGCEAVIEHQLDAFELRDTVSHNQGSYYALIADTITRYEGGEPILFYTWSPLWVGSVLKPGEDVVQLNVPFSTLPNRGEDVDTSLEDGSNPGFDVNTIQIIANREFLEENPAAERFFELVQVPLDDVNAELLREYEGEDQPEQIYEHAEEWIAANQETFDSWIQQAVEAAGE